MKSYRLIALIAVLLLPLQSARCQKFEGLAKTPQMGWNSWNKFQCNINEDLIRDMADIMVEKGLVEAGYIYLNLDDCWHGGRDSLGFIYEDADKFPSGMKNLADYIHAKGMKFGIYSDAGTKTCGGYPGSLGHEYQDAIKYAQWGVDYLKYDWCNTQDINPKGAYRLMRDALFSAGRPVLFSMCEWGGNQPWLWAKDIGHSWRTTGDIAAVFDGIVDHGTWRSLGVLQILDLQHGLREFAGPGHWNDPDMLEVGNGMSVNEDRAHFTMWCMLAAPLLLGNDLTNMSDETLEIITNMDVIAIDQDPLGIQGLLLRSENGLEFWFKPLENDAWAFCILNRSEGSADYTIKWSEFDFTDEFSGRSTMLTEKAYNIKDLWKVEKNEKSGKNEKIEKSGKNEKNEKSGNKKNNGYIGKTGKQMKVTIPGHDVLLLRLDPVR